MAGPGINSVWQRIEAHAGPRTHTRSSSECRSAWRRLGQLSSFRRFEIAASRRISPTPSVSTSTLRATERLCHSSVRPVST